MAKQKPIEIDVVAIFNKGEAPRPHMFKVNGKKCYVDYIAELFEDAPDEGECYVYRCRSNMGEDSHSVVEYVYEIRFYIHECKWVLQWMIKDGD